MRDMIVDAQAHEARSRFIESIDQNDILKLASSYHSNKPSQIFRPVKHGSFNVCFFVEFPNQDTLDAPDRWVVRLPIPDRVLWVNEKIDVEIATMSRYVAANTTIPIPKIRAYSLVEDSPIKMTFIIMDYVEGKNLQELGFPKDIDTWWSPTTQPSRAARIMYQNLAQIYAQLRRLEFPEIGALGLPTGEDDDPTIRVRHRPLCIEILLQQVEGLEPTAKFPEKATFKTAKDYVDALLWLEDNMLQNGKNSLIDIRGGDRTLYASHHFRKFVTESWLEPALDGGPFVLMHGDLDIQNLLWDDDINLVAVLDWEWSAVVPLQFFVPSPWLHGNSIDFLCHSQKLYNLEVRSLCNIMRHEEQALGLRCPPELSTEWAKSTRFCHTLVACALLRPEYVFNVFWSFINYHLIGFRPRTDEDIVKFKEMTSSQLAVFMQDGDRKDFLARKEVEQKEYVEMEKAYFGTEDEAEDTTPIDTFEGSVIEWLLHKNGHGQGNAGLVLHAKSNSTMRSSEMTAGSCHVPRRHYFS
ncbi:hypothetical protein AK830_g4293 [Neonectria ditissima]|uniref:Aminoglycoside phosphotransferase domain-containing protein n=1 Tax=Neonectria ditissima TaxID=78410 RepID=A0A0P7BNP3_9HYPO|nr:hypothetical protein AK830_g4293 [Neonectria ditissima]